MRSNGSCWKKGAVLACWAQALFDRANPEIGPSAVFAGGIYSKSERDEYRNIQSRSSLVYLRLTDGFIFARTGKNSRHVEKQTEFLVCQLMKKFHNLFKTKFKKFSADFFFNEGTRWWFIFVQNQIRTSGIFYPFCRMDLRQISRITLSLSVFGMGYLVAIFTSSFFKSFFSRASSISCW